MNDQLTEQVIGCAFRVHNTLGYGFLESVYEKSLSIELSKLGIRHQTQASIQVYYDSSNVGDFSCDILVEDRLIVELKSVSQIAVAHEVQLVNYLVATKIDLGLVINFGPDKVEVRRKYREYLKEN
ncbi:GxxExxY protein [Planctomicrobium sp.]|jgi:GxxExxY protein|nr:GxxExxY protein [bacterium]MDB4439567.1 GxxExxY protein [Planctomicrobium sp.]MDB4731608.1 GxxExxY protein [bacterium]